MNTFGKIVFACFGGLILTGSTVSSEPATKAPEFMAATPSVTMVPHTTQSTNPDSGEISLSDALGVVEEFRQMMIGANQSGYVYPKSSWDGPADRNYNIKGSKIRKFLHYEKQNCGINLGWTDNASAETARKRSRWFFARRGSDGGPILYGESVAMGFGKSPSFIKYHHRTVGVNLDWSKAPVYEWKILGGTPGTPVRTSDDNWVMLYNVAHKEPLIYFERDDVCGTGDIGWPDSKTWRTQAEEYLKDQVDEGIEKTKEAAIAKLTGSTGG